MFCANVPYVSQWTNIFLPQTLAATVFYTYILLLCDAFTVLVLLVCKCGELLSTSRHTESKYDKMVTCVLTSFREMTWFQFIRKC